MSGAAGDEGRADAEVPRAEQPDEAGRRARADVERNRPDALDRLAREQRHRIDGGERRDRHVGHDRVVVGVARVLDDRHQPEIDLAGLDEIGAARRHVEAQRDVRPRGEALDQRPRVEIADRAEADDRRSCRHAPTTPRSRRSRGAPRRPPTVSKRAVRATGVSDAARMLRRTSSTGARRGPSGASSVGRHVVEIVGAEQQRHLTELGPVLAPVDLDAADAVDQQRRQRDQLDVVVAGGRRLGRDAARQRRDGAERPGRLLQRGDAAQEDHGVGRRVVDADDRHAEPGVDHPLHGADPRPDRAGRRPGRRRPPRAGRAPASPGRRDPWPARPDRRAPTPSRGCRWRARPRPRPWRSRPRRSAARRPGGSPPPSPATRRAAGRRPCARRRGRR